MILGSLIVYLTCITAYPDVSKPQQTSLNEPKPTVDEIGPTPNGGMTEENSNETVSIIGQSDIAHEKQEDNKGSAILRVLLTGIPNTEFKEWSITTVGVNVLLVLFSLDLVFRGPLLHPSNDLRFSRVGFVNSSSASVLFREPDTSQLPVFAYLREEDRPSWSTADRIYFLDAETDYTYPIVFPFLKASTTYTYSLSNNLSGTFTTAPSPRSPASNKLTFLTSSCIKANFPYNPFSHPLSVPGLTHLSSVLRSLPNPASFMLFLGDFIYVDVPLRLSSSTPHYRAEHRRVYASPSWSLPGLASLPWLHTMDDHEIANDWAQGNSTPPFPSAQDPFIHYHVSVNPPTPPDAATGPNTTYFTFTRGPASFFMLDTRAYRTDPEPNLDATILGAAQLSSLLSYISTPEPANVHWKIIATSVPFTKNWRFGTKDSWGGYLRERAVVLSAMHRAESRLGIRVVILSGDRHEFGAIRFPPPNSTAYPTAMSGPHEFSVGPLSMFYLPFRTFQQIDEEDVPIKYLPDGNSKIGAIEITNFEGVGQQRSLLKYSLYVDSAIKWEYSLTSPAPAFSGYRGGVLDMLWS